MAQYPYTKANANLDKLTQECQAAGLPVTGVNGGADNLIVVLTSRDLTPTEKTTLDTVVANHDGRVKKPRIILDICTDLGNLSPTQQLNVWNDITSGNPQKWLLNTGPNQAAIIVMREMAVIANLTVSERNERRQWAVAFYVQDNPNYLVNPSFDPTINLPGDQLA